MYCHMPPSFYCAQPGPRTSLRRKLFQEEQLEVQRSWGESLLSLLKRRKEDTCQSLYVLG